MFVVEITDIETKETRYVDSQLHIKKEITDLCKFDDFEDASNVRLSFIAENPGCENFWVLEVVQY